MVGRAEKWNPPGAGGRGMAVAGAAENEPHVLVASGAGQEPGPRPMMWEEWRQKRLGLSSMLRWGPGRGGVA